jgi:uncharacterized membrane protein (UPF0127 family)
MKKQIKLVSVVAASILVLFFVYSFIQQEDPSKATDVLNNATFRLNDTELVVEIAFSDQARIKGLSGRTSLDNGSGMLFVFDRGDRHGIWMKEMNFAIDILWFDQNLILIDMKTNATPDSYPTAFRPSKPAWYVLEVPEGFVLENNIQIGDDAELFMRPFEVSS